MHYWVIEGLLAKAARPGYGPGPEFHVSAAEVDRWVDGARSAGVASIICLLDEDQLPLYRRDLPHGLIHHYRTAGFEVAHIPTFDGQTEPFTADQYRSAWEAFVSLPKPVLVHCSAGFDRTGRIVDHILSKLEGLPDRDAAS